MLVSRCLVWAGKSVQTLSVGSDEAGLVLQTEGASAGCCLCVHSSAGVCPDREPSPSGDCALMFMGWWGAPGPGRSFRKA